MVWTVFLLRIVLRSWECLVADLYSGEVPGAQMTAFELVLVFLIGGVLILCIMDDDRSLTNSTTAVITVGMTRGFPKANSREQRRYPAGPCVTNGQRKQAAVEAIQHPAMAGEQRTAVLDAGTAL